ncbi:hypothetical protein CC2G_003794 [Coprinopsis cinerea AmutBmut pab1-1]|nr:hypothetical protein CC2G_003794 [Coprinopsis cinerea AmutBmut pab1-1]
MGLPFTGRSLAICILCNTSLAPKQRCFHQLVKKSNLKGLFNIAYPCRFAYIPLPGGRPNYEFPSTPSNMVSCGNGFNTLSDAFDLSDYEPVSFPETEVVDEEDTDSGTKKSMTPRPRVVTTVIPDNGEREGSPDITVEDDPFAYLGPMDLFPPHKQVRTPPIHLPVLSSDGRGPEALGSVSDVLQPFDDSEIEQDEDTELESDASSELSDGVDLCNDFEEAMSSGMTWFGQYQFSTSYSNAPDPLLSIQRFSDNESLSLPLTDHDAQTLSTFLKSQDSSIRQYSPFEGRCGQVFKAASVGIGNPKYEKWIQARVVPTLLEELGVNGSSEGEANLSAEAELRMAGLYGPGSSIPAFEESRGTGGVVATFGIVLPSSSPPTGGDFSISYSLSSSTTSFSRCHSPSTTTHLFAFYRGPVQVEKRTLASGYHLILFYSLRLTNLSYSAWVYYAMVPPDMDEEMYKVDRVLRKWKEGKYDFFKDRDLLIYVLDGRSFVDGVEGLDALEGADLHKALHLLCIAERRGFGVGFSRVTSHILMEAWQRDPQPAGEVGTCDSPEDAEEWELGDLLNDKLMVGSICDKGGRRMFGHRNSRYEDIVSIVSCYVPQYGLEKLVEEEPGEVVYRPGKNGSPGTAEERHTAPVLILFPLSRKARIQFEFEGGIIGSLEYLKTSSCNPPTDKDRKVAYAILEAVDRDLSVRSDLRPWSSFPFRLVQANVNDNYPWGVTPADGVSNPTTTHNSTDVVLQVMDYAARWRDLKLWDATAERLAWAFITIGSERVKEATEVFEWRVFKERLSRILKTVNTKNRMEAVRLFAQSIECKNVARRWIEEMSKLSGRR